MIDLYKKIGEREIKEGREGRRERERKENIKLGAQSIQ